MAYWKILKFHIYWYLFDWNLYENFFFNKIKFPQYILVQFCNFPNPQYKSQYQEKSQYIPVLLATLNASQKPHHSNKNEKKYHN